MAQAAEFCSFQAKFHLEGIMSTKTLPGLIRERETKYKLILKQIKNQSKLIHMHVQYELKKDFFEL